MAHGLGSWAHDGPSDPTHGSANQLASAPSSQSTLAAFIASIDGRTDWRRMAASSADASCSPPSACSASAVTCTSGRSSS